jgi:hypothetical protein
MFKIIKSKKDIYDFIIISLEQIENKIIIINDEEWTTISSFRRAFNNIVNKYAIIWKIKY